MKKDVIYIDTEDDITSIIEKVKSRGAKIVALVPPKRSGVLQSAVNLKLLHKAAHNAKKRIVLITSNKALASLAAGSQIPVAKTLQSRPELAPIINSPDNGDDDVIDGQKLPVGELQKTAPHPTSDDEELVLPDSLVGEEPPAAKKPSSKKAIKIPNFDKFRKKLLFIIAGVVALIIFLVWAIFFAPHATVNISAKTSAVDVSLPVTLDVEKPTNPSEATIKPAVQQVKKTNTEEFNATGEKEVGQKASGTVTISNCSSRSAITIPSGTAVSSDGLDFLTASTVTVPGGTSSTPFGGCDTPGTKSVAVRAKDIGDEYNLSSGSVFTVAGQNAGVNANNPNAFSGGSKKKVRVISSKDVAAAEEKITSQDSASIQADLTKQFDDKKVIILKDSFKASHGSPNIIPSVGSEADSGQVTIETTYVLFGLVKSDVDKTLEAFIKEDAGGRDDQRVYNSGIDEIKFEKYNSTKQGATLEFNTTGQIGPNIDTKRLKPQLVDKNYEEIRQLIKQVDGIDDVDTQFFPFWIGSVSSEDRIDIKFAVSKS